MKLVEKEKASVTVAESIDLLPYCQQLAERARQASFALGCVSGEQKNRWLRLTAQRLRDSESSLQAANQRDLDAAPQYGLSAAQIDRLRLTPKVITSMAQALEEIAMLADPVGEIIEGSVRPNGLEVSKVRVPLGVVFFIYESRPNVTTDAAAICLKSGNAVILRGGKEALHSNQALAELLGETLTECGLPQHAIQVVQTTDRQAVGHLLSMSQWIDVAIPRGGESLIRRVAAEAKMPVIKHFDGNCHVYIDRAADLEVAERVTINAKCQRMGVCNAAESLLVHREIADVAVPRLGQALAAQGVEIRADEAGRKLFPAAKPATEVDFRAEFLGPVISLAVVDSLDQAVAHIQHYGSHHTDAIITTDLDAARQFVRKVDSAAVMVNASTRFNDGGEFGLGAEIGISTDKFHARGPCGLRELTSYKYVVYGTGQTRH